MKKIILASTSPRRKELLKKIGIEFEIIPPDYDENIIHKPFSYELVESVAEKKGLSIADKLKEDAIVISADTVVVYKNEILGKPKNYDDAFAMLYKLNGNTHIVVTSVCIFDTEKNKKIIKSNTSKVTFKNVSEIKIKDYINKFSPYDKAGAYGIQEMGENYIKEINGDYDNIVGLPTKMLKKMLDEINLL